MQPWTNSTRPGWVWFASRPALLVVVYPTLSLVSDHVITASLSSQYYVKFSHCVNIVF